MIALSKNGNIESRLLDALEKELKDIKLIDSNDRCGLRKEASDGR